MTEVQANGETYYVPSYQANGLTGAFTDGGGGGIIKYTKGIDIGIAQNMNNAEIEIKFSNKKSGTDNEVVSDNNKESAISKRLQYMGKTPSKMSKTGSSVINRMSNEGKIQKQNEQIQFLASNDNWYPIKEADMAHKIDAVTWWNETGRKYGAKSKEARQFMLNPDNYYLEHYSINRSQGAKLRQRYLQPTVEEEK